MTKTCTEPAEGAEPLRACQQDLIRSNIELNKCTTDSAGGSALAHELTWGVTEAHQLPQQWQSPDVVVAADVVYRQELFQPLLSALEMVGKHSARLLRKIATPHFLKGQHCTFNLTAPGC